MKKKLPKILTILFIVVFLLQLTALLFLLINPALAIEFTPQVGIGNDFQAGVARTVGGDTIAQYIKAIYQYGIGVVGILSTVVLMFGGLLWLTAGGNTGQVTEAKEWIKAALTGLIIALFSYIILLTINPDLINFQPLNITPIEKTAESNSDRSNGNNGLSGVSEYGITGFPSQAAAFGYQMRLAVIGDGDNFLAMVRQDTTRYRPFVNNSGVVIPGTYLDNETNHVYSFYNDVMYDGTPFVGVHEWAPQ